MRYIGKNHCWVILLAVLSIIGFAAGWNLLIKIPVIFCSILILWNIAVKLTEE